MKKNILTHVVIVAAMLAATCIYFAPILQGKALVQGDQQKSAAMSYQMRQEEKRMGQLPNWNESMFGGMPAYQTRANPQKSVFSQLQRVAIMHHLGRANDIAILFLYLVGFYLAMLLLGLSPWLALIGAIGFGLGSYNIIIIEAGHSTKGWCIAMMAPILAGMAMVLKTSLEKDLERKVRNRRVLWGSLLFTVALIFQITSNHIQITFYTAVGCLVMGVVYLVYAIRSRRLVPFAAKVGLLVVCAALAVGCNVRHLLVNQEFAKYTMRGGSELTVSPDDRAGGSANTASGLKIDYAFQWSYGIGETYTLLVPGAMGGGSSEKVGTGSAFYKSFRTERAPLYWGEQMFTSGPVYFGAVLMLLFFLGMLLVKGPERWWLGIAAVISVLLSWGSNFMPFNEWVFNHVPFYNKFRTPSMALVLANVCVAIMAVLALQKVLDAARDRKRVNRALYICTGALAAVILVVLVVSGSFSWSGLSDRQMEAQYGSQWSVIFSALASDRAHLFASDSWRSLLFIVAAAAILWLYNNDKIKGGSIVVALIGVAVLVDMWTVDRRYLSDDNFVDARRVELRRDQWDYAIDEQAAAHGDSDYRVFNMAVNTFNDSKPAAFHDQVGGYSAAKLSRYQDLIDFYLSRQVNIQVLNMLNARYLVMQDGRVQRNPDALGNAWFVDDVRAVGSPDEEIVALASINAATTAVVDTSLFSLAAYTFAPDSAAAIALEHQGTETMNRRRYVSNSSTDRLAVFSEIYYAPDWRAYIDGKPAEYIRADYVLRAMTVPAGRHVVEFINEAPMLHRLDNIGLVVSIITLMAMLAAIAVCYWPEKKNRILS